MAVSVVVHVYVRFKAGDQEARKSTVKKLKEHFEVNMCIFWNPLVILGNIHAHTAYSSADEILESMASMFDLTKVEVGYLDLYEYKETRFLHWPSETHAESWAQISAHLIGRICSWRYGSEMLIQKTGRRDSPPTSYYENELLIWEHRAGTATTWQTQ